MAVKLACPVQNPGEYKRKIYGKALPCSTVNPGEYKRQLLGLSARKPSAPRKAKAPAARRPRPARKTKKRA